jgi:glutamate N-acetyltransferase/amino-acid N-acetyltransferase
VLQTLLQLYIRNTFNAVTVDGDRSTNDTCLLFATGASGAPRISRPGDRRLADFRRALEAVLLDLAHQLVRDGEGATKFIRVNVTGAEARSPPARSPVRSARACWSRPPSLARTPTGVASSWPPAGPTSRSTASA